MLQTPNEDVEEAKSNGDKQSKRSKTSQEYKPRSRTKSSSKLETEEKRSSTADVQVQRRHSLSRRPSQKKLLQKEAKEKQALEDREWAEREKQLLEQEEEYERLRIEAEERARREEEEEKERIAKEEMNRKWREGILPPDPDTPQTGSDNEEQGDASKPSNEEEKTEAPREIDVHHEEMTEEKVEMTTEETERTSLSPEDDPSTTRSQTGEESEETHDNVQSKEDSQDLPTRDDRSFDSIETDPNRDPSEGMNQLAVSSRATSAMSYPASSMVSPEMRGSSARSSLFEETIEAGTGKVLTDDDYERMIEEKSLPQQRMLIMEHASGTQTIVEWDLIKKPFLGGFISRLSDIEYHHASTQTPPPPKTPEQIRRDEMLRFHRETQTAETLTRSTQGQREASTQMARIGVYEIVEKPGEERTIVPKRYYTSNMLEIDRWNSAMKIQTVTRGWMARRRAQKLREEVDVKADQREERLRRKEKREEEQRQREIERRKNPKTKADFDLQYANLEAMYQIKKDQIHSSDLSQEDKGRELSELLATQTKWLQTIDALKMDSQRQRYQERIEDKLREMAASKKVVTHTIDSDVVKIHTNYTLRAKELRHLYLSLQEPTVMEERIDILYRLKEVIQQFDCHLTRDIADLIFRLSVTNSHKTRLNNLFLQFIETPEFNPEAARYQKVTTLHSNTQPLLKPERRRVLR
ncbi:hypothetical protein PROFUN_04754 [Planoprotostelium fungivorum]|uniref:IQ motif and ubiquitin-like domain-containing protein n=1 Tax=Planoprotostelium fungivorum TaxID=1890364 RepID=A0A2P6NG32_9EUKA|nr:hypothetical protein PROFUN_04754 [Planoprotostelium fungivorum]